MRLPVRDAASDWRPGWLASLGVFVASVVAVFLMSRQPSPWADWRPATCMPGSCFCEEIRGSFVRQPANTLSGLLFLPVGILVLGYSAGVRVRDRRGEPANLMSSRAMYPVLFGCAVLLTGIGTAFYHASLTFWGQTADLLGMYLLATFLVLYNTSRTYPLRPAHATAFYVGSNGLLAYLLVALPEARRYAFAILIVAALALESAARRRSPVRTNTKLLQAAVAVLALGFVVWILDLTRTLCRPDSWFQGHAAWHLAGAAATGLVFLFYRSEKGDAPPG